jgi:pyruvate/2-oxoglutarate dehydrogenase complex dihydrolipoamide acyltransferase (E2) component
MQARLKVGYKWNSVTACGGALFVKTEWRNIPKGREDEAANTPQLELRDVIEGDNIIADAQEVVVNIVNASKNAIELAELHGVDLALVIGSGKNNRINIKNVRDYIAKNDVPLLE